MRFFHTLVGSFHSAALYRQVRHEGRYNLGYALLLVLLCTLVMAVYFTSVVHREFFSSRDGMKPLFDDVIAQIAAQTPVMTYNNGQLKTQTDAVTTITINGTLFGEPFQDLPLITIDTTGASNHTNMKTPVLITESEFIAKSRDKKTEIRALKDVFAETKPQVLNRAVAEDMAARFTQGVHERLGQIYFLLGGMLWLGFAFVSYILRVILLMALGVGGTLAGKLLRSPVNHGTAVGLASVSFTPVALLISLLTMCFGYSPHIITTFAAGLVALTAAIACSREPVVG
ncbi:MAG: DUF1189 family protein [Pseudomonadota bacterium]